MKIRIKYCNKYINVDVSEINCNKYNCFSPHKYQHRNIAISGSVKINQDKFYSCARRNYHGCPVVKKIK